MTLKRELRGGGWHSIESWGGGGWHSNRELRGRGMTLKSSKRSLSYLFSFYPRGPEGWVWREKVSRNIWGGSKVNSPNRTRNKCSKFFCWIYWDINSKFCVFFKGDYSELECVDKLKKKLLKNNFSNRCQNLGFPKNKGKNQNLKKKIRNFELFKPKNTKYHEQIRFFLGTNGVIKTNVNLMG